jgi:hypothetical protein
MGQTVRLLDLLDPLSPGAWIRIVTDISEKYTAYIIRV